MRRRIRIIGIALVAIVLQTACNTQLSTVPARSVPGTTTTIILVRHAERPEGLDPALNAEGRQRAAALADALDQNGVTAIYTPDLRRNRETAAPLAERLDLDVNLIGALQIADTKALANQFVDEVLEVHAGGVVLWIGNTGPITPTQSGNLQEIYARLGGDGRAPIRYQDMYIAVISDEDDVRFIETEYGGPSSLD
jgi:hypothetical protein